MVSGISAGISAFVSRASLHSGHDRGLGAVDSQSPNQNASVKRAEGVDASQATRVVEPPTEGQSSKEPNGEELTEEEKKIVQELKKRDAEVRAHEQAHAAVGGNYASAPSYEYTTGPDGKRYATSGEVQIDTAPVGDNPEATIRKMDIVIRAALAPADPSPQDVQVARQAQQTRAKAQAELAKKRQAEQDGDQDKEGAAIKATEQGEASDAGTLSALIEALSAYKEKGGHQHSGAPLK